MLEKSERPWGRYEVLQDLPTHKVKAIWVDPGKRLSYQRHKFRAEHWFIVQGTGEVTIDGKISQLIPPKVKSVDPVGSGDAFTGGTIAALLSGKSALEALTQGSYCGARVASMFGDWTGIPSGKNGIIDEKIKNEMSK